MESKFWAITCFFNPAKYSSLLNNYFVFSQKMKKQKVNLLTVECAFEGDEFQIPSSENVLQLRSNSIMWQKERLINYGISQLPSSCESYAWIDCDVIFFNDNWANMASDMLKSEDIIQLYKKVYHFPKDLFEYDGSRMVSIQSVFWQKLIHKNWLERRKSKELPFSSPGFAWAAKRNAFDHAGEMYDRNIIGSGDTFIVDCLLDSWSIHGFYKKFTNKMKEDMFSWKDEFLKRKLKYNYLPIDIGHLWHGSLKNRQYMDRHNIILDHNYDPQKDIILKDSVYEWNSTKNEMHKLIKDYFFLRREDEE